MLKLQIYPCACHNDGYVIFFYITSLNHNGLLLVINKCEFRSQHKSVGVKNCSCLCWKRMWLGLQRVSFRISQEFCCIQFTLYLQKLLQRSLHTAWRSHHHTCGDNVFVVVRSFWLVKAVGRIHKISLIPRGSSTFVMPASSIVARWFYR